MMWHPQPQTNRPKISVASIASAKKINPALTTPCCSVYIASDGSIGDSVRPITSHCIMCSTMSKFTPISAAARHRLVVETRISLPPLPDLLMIGSSTDLFFVDFLFSQPLFIQKLRKKSRRLSPVNNAQDLIKTPKSCKRKVNLHPAVTTLNIFRS